MSENHLLLMLTSPNWILTPTIPKLGSYHLNINTQKPDERMLWNEQLKDVNTFGGEEVE